MKTYIQLKKMSDIPVIIMDPSTGHKNASSSVSVLLNIAGVDANLQKGKQQNPTLPVISSDNLNKRKIHYQKILKISSII